MRSIRLPLATLVAALALAACGPTPHPPPGPTTAEALHDVEVWIFGADDELAAVARGSVDPVHFDPGAFTSGEAKVANLDGWTLGFDTYVDSSFTLENLSDLRSTETAQFSCYVFNWYLAHPNANPEPQEFEEFLLTELVHRYLPPSPREQFSSAAENLRRGIVQAQSSPEAVANTAATTFCSIPSR